MLSRRGLTLIELLIVVAIIAILAAAAVPNFLESQTRAKVARTRADLRTLTLAIEAYAIDYNSFPLNGLLATTGKLQTPQTAPLPAAHKFLCASLTTPVAYASRIFEDVFVMREAGLPESWAPFHPRYFYTNLDWFAQLTAPHTPAVISEKCARYGEWILAGAGPDRDRLDLALDLFYDPSNGTVSNGDIVTGRRTGNQ